MTYLVQYTPIPTGQILKFLYKLDCQLSRCLSSLSLAHFFLSGSVKEAKKILLVDHKKAELWLSAGGHVEIDEHPKKNVERECAEELGAEAGFWLKYPLFLSSSTTVGQTAGHTDVSLWYLLKGHSNTPYYFDRGAFHAIHWFSVDEVSEQKTDPHMARFIEKLKSLFI